MYVLKTLMLSSNLEPPGYPEYHIHTIDFVNCGLLFRALYGFQILSVKFTIDVSILVNQSFVNCESCVFSQNLKDL